MAVIVVVPDSVAPFAGAVIATVGSELSTVIVTLAEVRVLPAASRATALSVWLPFVSVFVSSDSEYGLEVSAEPTLLPSTRNCTLCTPTLSDAVAVTDTVSDTSAPAAGAVTDTFGSELSTVTVTFVEVPVFPAASRATALSVWEPFVSVVVFTSTEYGLVVSADPTLLPSTRNCTFCTPTLSEAVAVTVTVPPMLAPAAGRRDGDVRRRGVVRDHRARLRRRGARVADGVRRDHAVVVGARRQARCRSTRCRSSRSRRGWRRTA